MDQLTRAVLRNPFSAFELLSRTEQDGKKVYVFESGDDLNHRKDRLVVTRFSRGESWNYSVI